MRRIFGNIKLFRFETPDGAVVGNQGKMSEGGQIIYCKILDRSVVFQSSSCSFDMLYFGSYHRFLIAIFTIHPFRPIGRVGGFKFILTTTGVVMSRLFTDALAMVEFAWIAKLVEF